MVGAWTKSTAWKHARIDQLVAQNGHRRCWLCDLEIPTAPKKQGRHASLEHLEPRCAGGSDELHNTVLCHDSCNRHLGNRPKAQKLKMRTKWHRAAQRVRALRRQARSPSG